MMLLLQILVILLSGLLFGQTGIYPETEDRRVAVTFDDLPLVAVSSYSSEEAHQITLRLIKHITENQIPAVGFVNEEKLFIGREQSVPDSKRLELLKQWVYAGLELGNHTFSHPSMNSTALEDFQKDLVKGETYTRELLKAKGKMLRYFRHPFLHTGLNTKEREEFEKFLSERGYTIAPVTIDNSEWIFAHAYHRAFLNKDSLMMKRVMDSYIPYMEKKIEYFEKSSHILFGREISQVLLLHANRLNSDCLGRLAQMIRARGYGFITLDEALKDDAYNSQDAYYGKGGISWLHRWAITRGIKGDFFKGEPETPRFVLDQAGLDSE